MKREILCPPCKDKLVAIFIKLNDSTEHYQLEHGLSRADYRCDSCGKDILSGTHCIAVSIWADGRSGYYEWEHEFITPLPTPLPRRG